MSLSDDIQHVGKEAGCTAFYQLVRTLDGTQARINWFALGEAKRLAETIRNVCEAYRQNGDEDSRRRLVQAAETGLNYLRRMGKYSIPEVVETQKLLDRIEMET